MKKYNRLKKNEWYVIFARDYSIVYIGHKYYYNIDEKYKDIIKYKIVILNNREIAVGSQNKFEDYFNMFKNMTAFINKKKETEVIIDCRDDNRNILEKIIV